METPVFCMLWRAIVVVWRAQSPDIVQLTLGSHQLEGKVVPLKKPLALLDFGSRDGAADRTGQHCEVNLGA